jgi:hypothetical protein
MTDDPEIIELPIDGELDLHTFNLYSPSPLAGEGGVRGPSENRL